VSNNLLVQIAADRERMEALSQIVPKAIEYNALAIKPIHDSVQVIFQTEEECLSFANWLREEGYFE